MNRKILVVGLFLYSAIASAFVPTVISRMATRYGLRRLATSTALKRTGKRIWRATKRSAKQSIHDVRTGFNEARLALYKELCYLPWNATIRFVNLRPYKANIDRFNGRVNGCMTLSMLMAAGWLAPELSDDGYDMLSHAMKTDF